MTTPEKNVGAMLGVIPQVVGHQLDDGELVALILDSDRQTQGVYILDCASEAWDASSAAEMIVKDTRRLGGDATVIVGYGEATRNDVAEVGKALRQGREVEPYVVCVVNNGWSTFDRAGQWSREEGQVADMAAAAVFSERLPAEATRAEYLSRFTPHKESTFSPVSAQVGASLDANPPSFRAEVACRTLDAIVAGASDRPERQATVAHLIANNRGHVRDAVIAHACESRPRTQALIDLYRGAPESLREGLASITGTVMYLQGGFGRIASAAVLEKAADDNGLASLTSFAIKRKMDPLVVRREIISSVRKPDSARVADEVWQATQSMKAPAPTPIAAIDPMRDLAQGPQFRHGQAHGIE